MATSTYRALQRIQQGRAVGAKLDTVAQRVAGHARSIAAADGVDVEIRVVRGIRPRGRAYTRVEMTPGSHEFGNAVTRRRRILGQAVARV